MKSLFFYLSMCFICVLGFTGCSTEDEKTLQELTVIFDSQGGSEIAPQKVLKGERLEKPTNPTKEGFTLEGWFTGNDKEWNFENDVVKEDMTLYAHWTATTWTVTFETNGGSEIAPQHIAQGSKLTDLPTPTKEGFLFEGWYYDAELTLPVDTEASVTNDLTLYAKWMKKDEITRENLEKLYEEVRALDPDDYTEETYLVLEREMENTRRVLDNPTATPDDIIKAYTALQEAQKQLEKAPYRAVASLKIAPIPDEKGIILIPWDREDILLNAIGVDASGQDATNCEVVFEYPKELEQWATNLEVDDYNLSFKLTPEAPADLEIPVTITSIEDTNISQKVILKRVSEESLVQAYIELVNSLPATVSFDNYMETEQTLEQCYKLFYQLSIEQRQREDVQKAFQQEQEFKNSFYSEWIHADFTQIGENKYLLFDFYDEVYTYEAKGKFPIGSLTTEWMPDGDSRFEQIRFNFNSDNTYNVEYRESTSKDETTPWGVDEKGEYRCEDKGSLQRIIMHITWYPEDYKDSRILKITNRTTSNKHIRR